MILLNPFTCNVVRPLNHLYLAPSDGSLITFAFAVGRIDLSKVTKLKQAEFKFQGNDTTHVIETLDTITPWHYDFKQVLIHIPFLLSFGEPAHMVWQIPEKARLHWTNLDRALTRRSGSHTKYA